MAQNLVVLIFFLAVYSKAANHQIFQSIEYLTSWKERADIMAFVTHLKEICDGLRQSCQAT